jgi:hypothetical protein
VCMPVATRGEVRLVGCGSEEVENIDGVPWSLSSL